MNDQLVSICIPAYNAANFIAETLESVLDQTYRNLEILVGDNCSSDDTAVIVRSFQAIDARVRLICHEENLGFVGNLNLLLAEANGEFIAFYHADDVYSPSIVAREMAVMYEDSAIDAVFSKACYFNSDETRTSQPQKQQFLVRENLLVEKGYVWGGLDEFLPLMLKHGNVFVCPTFMARKAAIIDAGGWDARYLGLEDVYMWMRLLASGSRLAIIPEGLIHYRVHNTSTTASYNGLSLGHIKESQHQLFDDFLVEHSELVTGKLPLKAYARRRARELLGVGILYLKQGSFEKFIEYTNKSAIAYKYQWYDKKFIQQRFPSLYATWKDLF